MTFLVICFGAICIGRQYAARISFWHDEAYQVQNVVEQSYAEVATTLGRLQTAPPLFMMAVKAAGEFLGFNEYALRLVPVLAGLVAMVLYARLAPRLLPPAAAALCAMTLAVSPKLIEHATELKQYSSDVLACVVLLLVAARSFRWEALTAESAPLGNEESSIAELCRRTLAVTMVASALFWYSETLMFVAAGIALAILPRFHRHRLKGCLAYAACHLPLLLSVGTLYLVSIRWQRNAELINYWIQHDGLPDYAKPWKLPLWLLTSLRKLCNYAVNPVGPITLVLSVIGGVTLWRNLRQRELLAALTLPMLLTLAAALIHAYPFGGSRATMFLVPLMLLLAGVGFARLLQCSLRYRQAAMVAAGVLVLSGIGQGVYCLVIPRNTSHPRPAIEYVQAHRTPGQAVWVPEGNSWEEFKCYWRDRDALVTGPEAAPDAARTAEYWLIFEFDPNQGMRKRQPLVDAAKATGTILDQKIVNGGAAYLVRFNK